MPVLPTIVATDLEGVLVPEIWIAVAERTGIPELRLTTRDMPDYDVLMQGRLRSSTNTGWDCRHSGRHRHCRSDAGSKEYLDGCGPHACGDTVRHVL